MSAAYCRAAPGHPVHGPYHDDGFPARDDRVLVEALVLEINQAGLSWLTILMKRAAFNEAYAAFDIDAVAKFGAGDRRRLMSDARIIRNRLKIDAAIDHARRLQAIRDSPGSFAVWLDVHHPRPKARMGAAVQGNVPVHRRRVPDEPGLFAGRASKLVSSLPEDRRPGAALAIAGVDHLALAASQRRVNSRCSRG
jgi:DNA-3-methyladenine glycosylase I